MGFNLWRNTYDPIPKRQCCLFKAESLTALAQGNALPDKGAEPTSAVSAQAFALSGQNKLPAFN
jgi:hypothetical protein